MGSAMLLLAACGKPVQLALTDTQWNNPISYEVEGRTQTVFQKKPLKFAEFQTTYYHSSWKKTSVGITGIGEAITPQEPFYRNIVGVMSEHSKSSSRYRLSDGIQESQVYTYNKFDSKQLVVGANTNSMLNWILGNLPVTGQWQKTYYVQVLEPNEQKPWELLFDPTAAAMNTKSYIGYFAYDEDSYYIIRPLNKVMGKNGPVGLFGSIGYEILNKYNKPVAAISLIGKGAVYFNTNIPSERFLMANLCSALLLYSVDA